MILPLVGCVSGNCVQVEVVKQTRCVDRLFDAESAPRVEFVVQGSGGHLAHQERQWSRTPAVVSGDKSGIVEVTIHNLVLAHIEVELPSGIVALGIGIEPSRKRQSQVDEAAKCPNRHLRSNHDLTRRVGPQNCAASRGQRSAIQGREGALKVRQPRDVCGVGVDLTTEEEAQIAAGYALPESVNHRVGNCSENCPP